MYKPKAVPYKRKFAVHGPPGAGFGGVSYALDSASFPSTPLPIEALNRVSETSEPPRVRTEFPETWLWEGLNITK